MYGRTCLVQRNVPPRFVRITRSKNDSSMSRMRGQRGGALVEVRHDGGVVDEHVDAPVLSVDPVHERAHVVLDADVGADSERLRAEGAYLAHHRLHRRDVGDGEPRALLRERLRHPPADALRAARDDDHLAFD